jgi:hypothetical protein
MADVARTPSRAAFTNVCRACVRPSAELAGAAVGWTVGGTVAEAVAFSKPKERNFNLKLIRSAVRDRRG